MPLLARLNAPGFQDYPGAPDPACWLMPIQPNGRPPTVWHKGRSEHPVRAFFGHLAGEPLKQRARIKRICSGHMCINPYHYRYEMLLPHHLSSPALIYASQTFAMPADPCFELIRDHYPDWPLDRLFEVMSVEYPKSDIAKAYAVLHEL